jgi:AcrR family transcriptional regulator
MARWQGDARRRLQDAALDLYAERGFTGTTAAAIAQRAGLTERTFFRHFADKKEVLFANEAHLQGVLTAAVQDGNATTPLDAAAAGLAAIAADLQPRHATVRRRARIIAAHPELHERELDKVDAWSRALQATLTGRGFDEGAAQIAAQIAIAVFRVAFARWVLGDKNDPDLDTAIRAALDELGALVR